MASNVPLMFLSYTLLNGEWQVRPVTHSLLIM